MAIVVDDSFKRPGAVPFKWEIRPGVPKIQHHQHLQEKHRKQLSPPTLPSPAKPFYHRSPSPLPRPKLKPPPAGSIFLAPPELRTRSFQSSPRTHSERWRIERPAILGEYVSAGCFPSPLLKRKDSKRRAKRCVPVHESEPDYSSDLETLARWSLSSRKSLSSFRESPTSTFYSSCQSSPRVVSDAEWAGFGLF